MKLQATTGTLGSLGRFVYPIEATLGGLWSLGEITQAMLRPEELVKDPHADALLADIAARGFYPPIEPESVALAMRPGGWIVGDNPHRRMAGVGPDRVVGHMVAGPPATRTLVLVCHCYGIPSPRLMSALFGLQGVDADVCTNIMAHHYRGSFRAWPGAGFTSARLSTFIENLRVAVTGVRALTMWLRARRSYDRVVALGFSIGGQLAFHLANTGLIDHAVLYCPVVSIRRSATELGLMGLLHNPLRRLLALTGSSFSFDPLRVTEPMSYPLAIAESNLHVVLQRHDALAPRSQVESIRDRYPQARWHELSGTHLFPGDRVRLHELVRSVVRGE